MALFDKRPEIPRSQFKEILKKSDTGSGMGRRLSPKTRENIEKLDFPKKFGDSISHGEYKRALNTLKSEKRNEHDFTSKIKLNRKIKFLEEIEKKQDFPK